MRKKILVIEEEPAILLMVSMRLAENNYTMITTRDGSEGLEKVRSESPDLVIVDLTAHAGFNFVKDLKNRKDETRLIPVIVLMDRDSAKDLFDANEVNVFFKKPVDSLALFKKIQETLKVSEVQRGTAPKALIIGIDWDAMRPIKAELEAKGFIVYVCQDSYQAIQQIVKVVPQVVFAPSAMAGMDIWEMGNLMAQLPVMKNVPFVIYDIGNTGQSGMQNVKAAQVLVYNSHEDLGRQVGAFLKEHFR